MNTKAKQKDEKRVPSWYEIPKNPRLKERAKELRKAGILSEVIFWNVVKNKQFMSLDFDRQRIIGNYIVDFYCKSLGLVVEIDGSTHYGKKEYDKTRDEFMESYGLELVHFRDEDVKKNLTAVMEYLEKIVKERKKELSEKFKHFLQHPDSASHHILRGYAEPPLLKEGNFKVPFT